MPFFSQLWFLGVYNHTSSSILCAYREFHMICIKEIASWFLWCPRNPWRLWRVFVQECEISKFSHKPRPDFSLFLLSLCTLWRTFLTCPILGSSRVLERLCHIFPSLWSLEELSQHRCNLCQSVGAAQHWFHWEKGICQRQECFVSQPSRMSPLLGHEESSVCFSQGHGRAGDALCAPHALAPPACVSRRKGDERHAYKEIPLLLLMRGSQWTKILSWSLF